MKVTQLRPALCDLVNCSPSVSSMEFVHGILQARIDSHLTFPSPGDLSDPGIEPRSLALQADSLPFEATPGKPWSYTDTRICQN